MSLPALAGRSKLATLFHLKAEAAGRLGFAHPPTEYDGSNRGDRNMKSRRTSVIAIAAALAFTLSSPVGAQWVKYQTPGIPRTADGKPELGAPAPKALDGRSDLSGIWRIDPAGYAFDLTWTSKPAR
jgi:hypothetical protein